MKILKDKNDGGVYLVIEQTLSYKSRMVIPIAYDGTYDIGIPVWFRVNYLEDDSLVSEVKQ